MKLINKTEVGSAADKFIPWIGSVILLPFILYFVFNHGKFTILDTVNLLIHEGGHGIFRFFGKFIHALGGTLMQIIIPSMFIFFYFGKKKKFATQAFLVWLGENLLNISVYVSDARARKLPLLGGNKVYHDWNYLLREIGLLDYDTLIGDIVFLLGLVIFLIALLIPLLIKEEKRINIDLNI